MDFSDRAPIGEGLKVEDPCDLNFYDVVSERRNFGRRASSFAKKGQEAPDGSLRPSIQ